MTTKALLVSFLPLKRHQVVMEELVTIVTSMMLIIMSVFTVMKVTGIVLNLLS